METIAIRERQLGTRTSSPINAVHAFSSGWAKQHEEHRYGTRKPQMWWVLTSRSWASIPINYFLIEHRDGLVLFDTGLDPAIKTDPNYIDSFIGRFLLSRIFKLHINIENRLDRVLAKNGFSANEIQTAVISHLHFDHVGGVAQIPQANLLVSSTEWDQLRQPHPEREWILREHIEISHARWSPIEFGPTDDPVLQDFNGSYDVAGDGSMVLLPTPGHTPGSLSMLIRQHNRPPILLAGDVAYDANFLNSDSTPGTGNPAELRATYTKIRSLKESLPGLVILLSHDPAATTNLQQTMNSGDQSQFKT